MKRSSASERVKRVNIALALIKKYSSNSQVVSELMKRYGVSERQAYRYVKDAEQCQTMLPIPEEKVVFTVKLPLSLAEQIREFSRSTRGSISDTVSQSIKTFLKLKQ